MFKFETSMAWPSAHELHLHARRARGQAVVALSRHAVSRFSEWLYTLVYNGGVRLAHRLAAERRLRRDIRILKQLQDRELSDIGLGRSEIEFVVRGGRSRSAQPGRAVVRRLAPAANGEVAPP
jgi:uncharacterized protein YjiS (DUF1127 family)